ncbi:hypothetical protein BGX34_006349, partial [Mortierella sp. NVP85]
DDAEEDDATKENDGNEGDGTEQDKSKFARGYIKTWWDHYSELPPVVQPVFIPAAGFRDVFHLMSERFLISLLWGENTSKDAKNHPTKAIMEQHICSRKDANDAMNDNYGELMYKLFVGDKMKIRKNRKKHQTSYGKRTVTIQTLSATSEGFSKASLKQYQSDHFRYIKAKKAALDTGSQFSMSPPAFPSNSDPRTRYALSNQLTTDGIQVHVLAFDTRRQRNTAKQRAFIPRLEERFADRQSIINDFGPAIEDTVVVGVDPGERISAAFCMIDPKVPNQVSNLSIRRNALYSPMLAHRMRLEDMKRRRIPVTSNTSFNTTLWTCPDLSEDLSASGSKLDRNDSDVELPSINDLQQSLGQSNYESKQRYQDHLRQYAQVYEVLNEFYAARSLKKLHWERVKAMRAEKDLAVHGALRMVQDAEGKPRRVMFVYGDGRFNTRTKLASMHETFKNYFVMK